MRIDRMLGIVTHLLRHGNATAGELAQRFEVSARTILRDVDALCAAGIPLRTAQGSGGGISIAEGYRMRENVLTESELRSVLAGVKAMDSIIGAQNTLHDKLPQQNTDWISIDLSVGAELFEVLKRAILSCRALKIVYLYPKGESVRVIEPLQLVYRWGGWYLTAWCRLREDYRLFRLSRIRGAEETGDSFAARRIPAEILLPDPSEPPIRLKVLADKQLYYLLTEQRARILKEMSDGRLCAEMDFANERQCLAWAMGLGDAVEVLAPDCVRKEILRQAKSILQRAERECDTASASP